MPVGRKMQNVSFSKFHPPPPPKKKKKKKKKNQVYFSLISKDQKHEVCLRNTFITIRKSCTFSEIENILVLAKKIFKGFYHMWTWRPSWSCILDHLYKLSFPLPKEAHIKFGFDWPRGFRRDSNGFNGNIYESC